MSNALKESHIYQNTTTITDGTAGESNVTSVLRMQRKQRSLFLINYRNAKYYTNHIYFIKYDYL